MKFRNPANGYVERATTPFSWLWALLITPLYYASKGIWSHAVVSLVLGAFLGIWTFGIGTLLVSFTYAIMNGSIVRSSYLRRGWLRVA